MLEDSILPLVFLKNCRVLYGGLRRGMHFALLKSVASLYTVHAVALDQPHRELLCLCFLCCLLAAQGPSVKTSCTVRREHGGGGFSAEAMR